MGFAFILNDLTILVRGAPLLDTTSKLIRRKNPVINCSFESQGLGLAGWGIYPPFPSQPILPTVIL